MENQGSKKAPAVAVVGCGYWGKNLVRNFAQLGALSHVCEPGEAGQKVARGLCPGAAVVTDFDAVLGSDVAGVVLATPAVTHHDLCRRALLAGKDVFVEKPLALHHEEAAELVAIAQERGQILMVGHVLEYHPAIRALISCVREGRIGAVQYVYSNRLNLGKIRMEENILWSFAPHDVAIILRLMDTMPLQVTSVGGGYVTANVTDATVSTLLFPQGCRAHIFVSWLHPFKEQRFVVTGSNGMLTYDDVNKQLLYHDKRVTMSGNGPLVVNGVGTRLDFPDSEPLLLECLAFLDAIQTRRQALTDGVSGLRTLRVLEAMQRSLSTGGEPIHMGTRF